MSKYLSASQPALSFKVNAKDGFTRRKSVTYVPQNGQGGPSFFVDFKDRHTMIVHDGPSNDAPVIGTVDVRNRLSKSSFTMRADSVTQEPIEQKFDESGWLSCKSSCRIPAISGNRRPIYTWRGLKSDSDQSTGFWQRMNSVVLVDDGGLEYATYTTHCGLFGAAEGEFKILNPQLEPEAIQQIVVSCAAFQEIARQRLQNNVVAATA